MQIQKMTHTLEYQGGVLTPRPLSLDLHMKQTYIVNYWQFLHPSINLCSIDEGKHIVYQN